MKRRLFLKGLLGGAVAGPTAAKQAADAAVADLTLSSGIISNTAVSGSVGSPMSQNDWASDALKRLLGRTAAEHFREKQRIGLSAIDPNVASLQSVSLHRKVEMTREIVYNQYLRNERFWLEDQINS